MHRASVLVVALVTLVGAGVCRAQSFGASRDAHVGLAWEVGQTRSGRLAIVGHVVNGDPIWAMAAVQLLVEGFDGSGRAVRETVAYIDGQVLPGARAYFEVPLPPAGVSYRVSVRSIDWFTGEASAP